MGAGRRMKIALAFACNALFNFAIGLLLARYLGPEEYGRFALAVAVAITVQTVAFDWMRLAAARFYSARVRAEEPKLRATLDVSLAGLILLLGLGTAGLLLSGLKVELSPSLLVLAIGTAIANGVFDLLAALFRARFLDGVYARLVIGKNVLSLLLTIGGAYWTGEASVALLGVVLSMAGAMMGIFPHLRDPEAKPQLASLSLARTLFRYGLPIVTANLLYQSVPLVDRLLLARTQGFAASGQFSFAYDIGVRLVSAIGSMLDTLLFQVAVQVDEKHGTARAWAQIGDNIGVVVAVLAPTCVGCWLVLPSFEQLVAPAEFQGAFGRYFALMLPGFFCYALIFFALHPVFQIRKTTLPLVFVAAGASLANLGILAFWPADRGEMTGLAVSLAFATGLVLLAAGTLLARQTLPRGRDLLGTVVSTAVMALVVRSLPAGDPGLLRLIVQAGLGAGVYGALALALDLCSSRAWLLSALRRT